MNGRIPTLLLAALVSLPAWASRGIDGQDIPFIEKTLTKRIAKDVSIRYLLHLPAQYESSGRRFPLLLYLHGGLGRGNDFQKLAWYPIPRMIREHTFPDSFIAVIPQCPEGGTWDELEDALVALVDDVSSHYRVDLLKIYGLGYSMGGNGILHLAYAHSDMFAAIASMSGYYFTGWASRLKDVPAWLFHGAKDLRIAVSGTDAMVEEYEKSGAEVKYSRDPEGVHRPPTEEQHLEVLQWFLGHAKKRRPVDDPRARTNPVESLRYE
jgi:predicted peptidase